MFAFPKLVLLLLVFGALWIFYRWVNNPVRELQRRRAARPPRPIPAEDLVACGVCGSYVAAVAPRCARRDCPRPR
jgi:peptidoglycan/LPS O-acetylase OafA/YrhL